MTRMLYQTVGVCALWVVSGALLCGVVPAHAQTATHDSVVATTTTEELRDPDALAELSRATDFLMTMQRFHIEAHVVYDVIQEDGRRLQFEKQGEIYLQRPDQLFAEVFLDNERHRQFWYDGKTLSFAELSRNLHTQTQAPPTIDAMLDMLEELLKDPMPLADLLYNDLAPLEQQAVEADVVGDSLVAGKRCTQLAFRGKTVDWQLWVDQGKQPFIHKLSVSYREEPGVPQYTAWIEAWGTPDQFKEDLFNFTVPPGSEFIKILAPIPRFADEGGQQ
jgi:hypothetical protein